LTERYCSARHIERPSYIPPDFPADAFAGTATYYAKCRPPYPPALIADLLQRTSITSGGRLLDLAAGPGRIAIPLAGHFREVWAVDLEPEMIAVGEQEARQRGVTNIRWITGKAEELVAEPDSFDLITIGDAFHRLDQQLIAARCRQWLRPDCCLAILGCSIVTNPWQRAVADTDGTRPLELGRAHLTQTAWGQVAGKIPATLAVRYRDDSGAGPTRRERQQRTDQHFIVGVCPDKHQCASPNHGINNVHIGFRCD
jgi:SAM-dependent methyltransferase